jgi:hypothetical protein
MYELMEHAARMSGINEAEFVTQEFGWSVPLSNCGKENGKDEGEEEGNCDDKVDADADGRRIVRQRWGLRN